MRRGDKAVQEAPSRFRQALADECDAIKTMLLEKNESYGDSAFEPVRLFSKVDADEGLLVRIDDKLSRIQKGREFQGDDDIMDLIGYLILLRVLRKVERRGDAWTATYLPPV